MEQLLQAVLVRVRHDLMHHVREIIPLDLQQVAVLDHNDLIRNDQIHNAPADLDLVDHDLADHAVR